MQILIQHNFTSGLGDFLADISHYLSILKRFKSDGYRINLRIALKNNKYTNDQFFKKIFDQNTCDFFDSIEETNDTIHSLTYNEYTYHSSNHAPQFPGYHHFDIFFDTPNQHQDLEYHGFDAQKAYSNNLFPSILPKFNNEILQRSESFVNTLPKDYYFLHIRTSDKIDKNTHRYDNIIYNIQSYIKNTNVKFHLGTNNEYIYNILKNYSNIFIYPFKNYNLINNDMNAFSNNIDYKSNITSKMLQDRLLDICAEMISIQKSKKIYFIHDVTWISNFLFYPICISKNTIELINKNIWSA
jgi:hypothetical protein